MKDSMAVRFCVYEDWVYGKDRFGPVSDCPKNLEPGKLKYVLAADFDRVTAERDALQERLNAADQQVDDAATENNEREPSRRSWFDEAKRLEGECNALRERLAEAAVWEKRACEEATKLHEAEIKLAERDALLRRITGSDHQDSLRAIGEAAALSASAELVASVDPIAAALDRIDAKMDRAIELCMADLDRDPVELDERAEFEAWVAGRKVCKRYGAKVVRTRDGYGDYRINDRWLAWQARAALDCPDCGDTGLEPCSKHGWKP